MLKLLYFELKELAEYIRNTNEKVYIYGAGMIGRIVIPDFLKKYEIEGYVKAYIDIEPQKHGIYINIGNSKIMIHSTDYLNTVDRDGLIIITNSHYSPIVELLDTKIGRAHVWTPVTL